MTTAKKRAIQRKSGSEASTDRSGQRSGRRLKPNDVPRTKPQAQARERALATLARMRRDKISLRAAAKTEQTNARTVRRYVGSALRQSGSRGRYHATAFDRISRTLNFLTPNGTVPVIVRDSRTASLIGEYMNAVKNYTTGRDQSGLKNFENKSFRASGVIYRFVTDPAILDRLADAGVLAIEGLYRTANGVSI